MKKHGYCMMSCKITMVWTPWDSLECPLIPQTLLSWEQTLVSATDHI